MRIFIVVVALASFTFSSAHANAVNYDITGSIDGAPGWSGFVASHQAPFRIDFTLDTSRLTFDYDGLYLSITPTNLSYQVGGVKENVTWTNAALEIESGYPQMDFDLLDRGNNRLEFQFSVNASTSLNPLYTQSGSGPRLNTGIFTHLTLSWAEILPLGTLNDIGLSISNARVAVTPVPESSTFLLTLAGLAGIAGYPVAGKVARRLQRPS